MPLIKYEKDERIATITLNRPEVKNAFTLKMLDELAECMLRFRSDDEAWVAVITGAGDVFSAGHDVNEINDLFDYFYIKIADSSKKDLIISSTSCENSTVCDNTTTAAEGVFLK